MTSEMKPRWLHFYVDEAGKKVSVLKEQVDIPAMSVQVYGDDTQLVREMAKDWAKKLDYKLEWKA